MSAPAQLACTLALPQELASQTQVRAERRRVSPSVVGNNSDKGKGKVVQRKESRSQAPVVAKLPLLSPL